MTSKTKLACILLGISFFGCGSTRQPVVQEELKVYVKTFYERTGIAVKSDVQFGPLERPTVGLCEVWSDGKTAVTIDPEAFDKYTDKQKEQLVYHEFGHCELGRQEHVETMTTKKAYMYGHNMTFEVPESIMYPYVFYSTWAELYDIFKAEYIAELTKGN